MSRLQKVSSMLRRRIRCLVANILWSLLGMVRRVLSWTARRTTNGWTVSRTSYCVLTTMIKVERLLIKLLKSLEQKPRYLKEATTLKTPVTTSRKKK